MPDKKPNRKRLFDDKRVVMAAAVLVAFFSWVVVAGFIMPADSRTIPNVRIDYERDRATYESRGLMMVDQPAEVYADVEVKGDGVQLGPLSNTSVAVYADYAAVTTPGAHEVPIQAAKVATTNFSIYSWSARAAGHSATNNPKTSVTMVFEDVVRKTFSIEVEAGGLKAASGYLMDLPRTTPDRVTISGPESQMALIARVVARVEDVGELTERKTYQRERDEVQLVLLDTAGNELDVRQMNLSIVPDILDGQLDVEIPILESRTILLSVDFVGKPTGLDEEWFDSRVRLSVDTLQVAGARSAFDNLQNPYPVATFNVSELTMNWEAPVEVQLPEGLRNQDELIQIVASFNTTGLVEKSFVVENNGRTTNIRVVNGPADADITPLLDSLTVKILGDEEQINTLLAEDIVVEIDAYGISSAGGQQTIPARVLTPGFDRLIPLGNYSVVCDVEVS